MAGPPAPEAGVTTAGAGGGAIFVTGGGAAPPPAGLDGDTTVTPGGCTACACAGAWAPRMVITAKLHTRRQDGGGFISLAPEREVPAVQWAPQPRPAPPV